MRFRYYSSRQPCAFFASVPKLWPSFVLFSATPPASQCPLLREAPPRRLDEGPIICASEGEFGGRQGTAELRSDGIEIFFAPTSGIEIYIPWKIYWEGCKSCTAGFHLNFRFTVSEWSGSALGATQTLWLPKSNLGNISHMPITIPFDCAAAGLWEENWILATAKLLSQEIELRSKIGCSLYCQIPIPTYLDREDSWSPAAPDNHVLPLKRTWPSFFCKPKFLLWFALMPAQFLRLAPSFSDHYIVLQGPFTPMSVVQ